MPPKKQAQAGGSKKAEQKKKEKIIEVSTHPPSPTHAASPQGSSLLVPRSMAPARVFRGDVSLCLALCSPLPLLQPRDEARYLSSL